ncbi:MAG: hypothetical protein OXP70_02320 [Acidobacteriota bacterium]|nr:hypothetical protein [Acidobacteriota bacterium]
MPEERLELRRGDGCRLADALFRMAACDPVDRYESEMFFSVE